MSQPSPLFKVIAEEPDVPPQPAQQPDQAIAIKMIQIALSAIWQQFVIAVAHTFTLLSGASVFVLYFYTSDPNVRQLVMLGGYALFVLAANYLVIWSRRK